LGLFKGHISRLDPSRLDRKRVFNELIYGFISKAEQNCKGEADQLQGCYDQELTATESYPVRVLVRGSLFPVREIMMTKRTNWITKMNAMTRIR
jgi:hypothetical protein